MRRLARAIGPVLAVSLLLGCATAATADEVSVTLRFDESQLRFDRHEGYDFVSLDGADYLTDAARPMLPVVNVQLLLPPNSIPIDIVAETGGTVQLPGRYTILPAPRPVRFSSAEAATIPQPEAEPYRSVLPYPREAVRLAGTGISRGYRIASVAVCPLRYVPDRGELTLITEVRVSVSCGPDESGPGRPLVRRSNARGARIAASVANPEDLARYEAVRARDGGATIPYLVVCPTALSAEFERLAAWKTRKGVRAEVVTLESIASNPEYDGVDAAEEIRNCIRSYYESCGTEWALLGGDTDVLPARDAYDFFYDQGIPCDLYYADLDRTWNDDGDERWGETSDAIDMYVDVYVGRAPVSSVSEASAFVDRVVAYEGGGGAASTDYQLDVLFLGEVLWDDPDPYTDGGVALDMIDDESMPSRFSPITKLYESAGSLDRSGSLSELNFGHGIVVHEGHANTGAAGVGAEILTSADLDGLTNGDRGGLWYSVGCWSAAIDDDTFGEHWLANPDGGGIAYVGNSRYGWGCPGYPGECASDLYEREFFAVLFDGGPANAGAVHAAAKQRYIGISRTDDYMRYIMYELNLLGDPETPVWTDTPRELVVTQTPVDPGDPWAAVEVEVTSGGAPVEGAVVCLCDAALTLYEVALTDAAGRATLALPGAEGLDVALTVTARDHLPHLGELAPNGGETGIGEVVAHPAELLGNSPNPFGAETRVAYSVARRQRVRIRIYDVGGRLVRTLVDDEVDPGAYDARWDGRDADGRRAASGVYFARMVSGGDVLESRMTLVR